MPAAYERPFPPSEFSRFVKTGCRACLNVGYVVTANKKGAVLSERTLFRCSCTDKKIAAAGLNVEERGHGLVLVDVRARSAHLATLVAAVSP